MSHLHYTLFASTGIALTATAQIVSEATNVDSLVNQLLDMGLVGAVAVMFYIFWRSALSQLNTLQNERIEELRGQRDSAIEERDLWYEENMRQYRERIENYQQFIASRGVVLNADTLLNPEHPQAEPEETSTHQTVSP